MTREGSLYGFLYMTHNRGGPWDSSHHFASVSGGAAPVDDPLDYS
jgi:hypothetical protein